MLVVAVLTSPIWPLRLNGGDRGPDCLRRNFGLPASQSDSTRPSAFSLRSTPARVKAVTSEREEDVVKLTVRFGHLLHQPPVPPSLPRPVKAADGLDPAVRPLRC
jgi:hypothetical protein